MYGFYDFFNQLIIKGILVYAIVICGSYALLAFISSSAISKYLKRNSYIDYGSILRSTFAPSISVIAPAYNEALTIIQNVRSLLSLQYSNFEVIIVNDGSNDNSLEKLIDAYELEAVKYVFHEYLATQPIKNIYKSKNPAYHRLLVIDKENGGKADALNVGMNISSCKIIACIDVDCIMEETALLKIVKPFMEDTKRVVAVGGVISIANSCEVDKGRLIKINLPKKFLPRVQVLEYFRAFLMGRMAWSRLDGLLLVSGAFGLFDKEIALKAGGYNKNTVGEDMELVVRMRRYMIENNIPYTVMYVPDPLCWTEAPDNLKVLGRQRSRWARGTIETLFMHRGLFFNPSYGFLGMVSYPYWFFFEFLAPWVESAGIVYFIILVLSGQAYWPFFLTLSSMLFAFSLVISLSALLFEERSFHQYRKRSDIFKLLLTAILEPVFYHPLTVYWSLRGNYQLLMGMKNWGEMTRIGFGTLKKKSNKANISEVSTNPHLSV